MSAEPTPDTDEFVLRDRIEVLRRHKVLVIATTAAAVAVAVAVSVLATPQYEASSEVLLQQASSDDVLDTGQQQNAAYLQQLVQTEIQVMQSRSVEQAVTAELGRTPAVTVSAKGDTQVVVIRARRPSRQEAVREADTYAEVYVGLRQDQTRANVTDAAAAIRTQLDGLDERTEALRGDAAELVERLAATTAPAERTALEGEQRRLEATIEAQEASLVNRRVALTEQVDQLELAANLSESRGVRVVSEASLPDGPVTPQPRRDVVLALVLGLLLGVALAFVRDHLDDTVRTREDLDRSTGGLNVLGLIPEVEGWRDRAKAVLESVAHPGSSAAEAYRGLRTSLQFIGLDRKVHLIQVTSSEVGEGKSTTAANLAVALARAGKRVVLVDCDLRRPRAHSFFGLDNTVGFTSVALGEVSAIDALTAVPDVPRLAVLASGPIPPNPSELLSTGAAMTALDTLDDVTDYVIIDSPPLLPVADSVILAGYVDAVILVASARTTTKRSIGRALELLRQIEAPVVGVVFNKVGERSSYSHGYGYAPTAGPRRFRRPDPTSVDTPAQEAVTNR